MADYIDRKILLQGKNIRTRTVWDGKTPDYNYIICVDVKIIEAQPSVDAVEVVRCKNCKYRETTNIGNFCQRICKIQENASVYLEVEDNDYCKWGDSEVNNNGN